MAEKLKIISLGGLNEIGKNLTVYEYGGDMIVVDVGMGFPDNDMYGIDVVIPDFTYLIQNRDRIRAIFITHGHEDHIGAIPYLMRDVNAPIYATRMSAGLIKLKLDEHRLSDKVKLITCEAGETVKALVTNRALLAIIAAAIFLLLSSLMVQAMNNYLFAEWFKNTRALSVVGFIGLPTTLALALATGGITERFGKKEAGVAGMLFTGVIFLLLFFFKVQNPWVFVGITFVANFGMFYFNMVIWAYITDVIDYQEVKTGSREDGTVYGVYSFARKIGQALAGGLSGFALSAIGYVSEPGAVQTDQVRQGIYNIATAFPGVCYLIVAAILWLAYPLTKNAVAENAAILAERREGGTGK